METQETHFPLKHKGDVSLSRVSLELSVMTPVSPSVGLTGSEGKEGELVTDALPSGCWESFKRTQLMDLRQPLSCTKGLKSLLLNQHPGSLCVFQT